LNQKLLMGAALVGSGIAIGLLVHWAISSRSKPSPSTRPRR
jgi:F0F1-type ATP synthase membrane subunit c/vacuolar-type H+-ATPase subunit K